jgi:RNA polymerase sigma factor (sigma-70 family)
LADLVQSGIVGLLQAHERYGRPPDDGFAAYATPRIRGAMLDAVRAGDWSPRSLRRRERSIEAAKARIEKSTGERASAAAIDALPERERVIFLLYYDEDLMMREIGARLQVSESRICQIHNSIIKGLRAAMLA